MATNQPDEGDRLNIVADPFDVEAFRSYADESDKLKQLMDPKRLVTAPELGQDVFDALFKYSPTLVEEDKIHPGFAFNRTLIQKAMGTQEYERLRAYTQLQETESAMATAVVMEELLKDLPEEDRKAVNGAVEPLGSYRKSLEQLKALEQLRQQGVKLGKRATNLYNKLTAAMPQMQAAAQQAQQALNQACQSPQAMAALRQALQSANQQVSEALSFTQGWGSDPGMFQKLPAGDRMRLMKHILTNEKLREITKVLGRLRRLALAKRQVRTTQEPSEVVDVERGDNVSRVLPSDLAKLTDEEREAEFMAQLLTGTLQVYKLEGKERVGRGPIIILIDTSGSMSGAPEQWAKGVALSLADIALKDKRAVEIISFSSDTEISKWTLTLDVPPKERLQKLLEAAEAFYGGGTDFEAPMDLALKDVEQSAFKKADIVVITDGIAPLSDAFVKKFRATKAKKDCRLHAIQIGGTEESLEKVCDEIHNLYDVVREGDKVAGALFEAI